MNHHIIISIKPHYAEKILSGEKIYEFRKKWTTKHCDRIYIYSSSPIMRIIGYAEILKVDRLKVNTILSKFGQNGGGISKSDLKKYFENHTIGTVIHLVNTYKIPTAINPYENISNFHPPQSYRFVSDKEKKELEAILKKNR